MRKLLLSLLLAGAVSTPAIARPVEESDRKPDRAERQQTREERQQARSERSVSPDRPRVNVQGRSDRAPSLGQPHVIQPDRFQQNAPNVQQTDGAGTENVRNWRNARHQQVVEGQVETGSGRTLRQSDRGVPNVMRPRTRTPVVGDVPRQGTQPPLTAERQRHSRPQWSTNWHNDHRYDWRGWRNRHRSLFHFGLYYDPFGWGYQPYSIGWRLWPNYYSSNYWINDPWEYRLPYAPGGTHWIRYYDDALLVDTYTGEVVDVIRNFFW